MRALALVFPFAALAIGQSPPRAGDVVVAPLTSPAGDRSGQPCAVRGADGVTRLSWIEPHGSGHRLRIAVCRDGKFGAPLTAAEGKGWFVNWADVPSVAALRDGTLAVHWLEKLGRGVYAYGVRVRTSGDGGRTWGTPFWLHRDLTPAEHGFAALVPYDDRRFAAVWLDGRAMPDGGDQTLRATLFGVRGRPSDEVLLDPRVCECCPTSIVLSAGSLVAAYRDRSGDEVRDIGVVRSRNGKTWTPTATLHPDGWRRPG